MSQQKAQQYADRVQKWIAERDAHGDYPEYERSNKVNRAALCDELDFSRSVVNQNPAVKAALAEAEERWYAVREQDNKAHEAARERSEKRANQRSADVSKLEDQVAELKAQNSELRKQLKRYAAMDEVIQKTGLAPRPC